MGMLPRDAYATYPHHLTCDARKAAANASTISADPSKGFLVGGTSAGGGLTDIVAHLARDEKLSPPLTGLLEMIPVLLPPSVVPARFQGRYLSREQCKLAPILSERSIKFFDGKYSGWSVLVYFSCRLN